MKFVEFAKKVQQKLQEDGITGITLARINQAIKELGLSHINLHNSIYRNRIIRYLYLKDGSGKVGRSYSSEEVRVKAQQISGFSLHRKVWGKWKRLAFIGKGGRVISQYNAGFLMGIAALKNRYPRKNLIFPIYVHEVFEILENQQANCYEPANVFDSTERNINTIIAALNTIDIYPSTRTIRRWCKRLGIECSTKKIFSEQEFIEIRKYALALKYTPIGEKVDFD